MWLWCRAWLQVGLVGCNVVLIQRSEYGWAFVTGAAISALWWTNVKTSARSDDRMALLVYAAGAGFGTVSGMWLGSRL